ncbi:MAG: addiction module protein [Actinobacteria bacterium]|nr:addiction module protein [Actinomycetota bacterium]
MADALRLDADARADVAAELLASLDGLPDPDTETAWAIEIVRRVAAVDAGTATLEACHRRTLVLCLCTSIRTGT